MNNLDHPNQKIFVVGVGRSGTSLVQAILGSHSQINFLPETGYIKNYLLANKLQTEFSTKGSNAALRHVQDDARLSRLPLDVSSKLENLITTTSSTGQSSLDLELYNCLHNQDTYRYSGDKDPRLVEHIELLLKLWPDAKIVHIFRDPRDVIASKKKAAWSKGKPFFTQLLSTRAQFHLGVSSSKVVPYKNLYTLQYEALITEATHELSELCNWLGLEFEQSMLSFTNSAKKLVFEDEKQWKSEVLGPLLSNNQNKWKNELTNFEIKLTELSCIEAMSLGGYEYNNAKIAYFQSLFAYVSSAAIKTTAMIYCMHRAVRNKMTLRELLGPNRETH